jgi:hypothetical protein
MHLILTFDRNTLTAALFLKGTKPSMDKGIAFISIFISPSYLASESLIVTNRLRSGMAKFNSCPNKSLDMRYLCGTGVLFLCLRFNLVVSFRRALRERGKNL